MTAIHLFHQIPEELKRLNQWVCWKYVQRGNSPKPTKPLFDPRTGQYAAVDNPATWVSFELAVRAVTEHPDWYNGIGFVLTEHDDYCLIDLDATHDELKLLAPGSETHEKQKAICDENYQRQLKIYRELATYAEVSPSGTGAHLIAKGRVPAGRKRAKIELYSSGRYMTMTGNWVGGHNVPINATVQPIIDILWEQLGDTGGGAINLDFPSDYAEKYTDEQIYNFCAVAKSSSLFIDLWNGNWQKYATYPSQSEADLALCNILKIYTHSKIQLTRMFLSSGLGATISRKANPDKYLSATNYGLIHRAFDNKLPPVDLVGSPLEDEWQRQKEILKQKENASIEPLFEIEELDTDYIDMKPRSNFIANCPGGRLGQLVQFLYNRAYMPVAEFAIAGGLFYGNSVFGRAYNISNKGLNQYIVNVGTTGVGKGGPVEAISALNKIIAFKGVPSVENFFGPGDFASKEGLVRTIAQACSIGCPIGEISEWLVSLLAPNCSPHFRAIKRELLSIYDQSGRTGEYRGSAYASKANSVGVIKSPSLSFMGDTVPDTFYPNVTPANISSGLFPRFTIVEYYGKRKPGNKNHMYYLPSNDLVDYLKNAVLQSHMNNVSNIIIDVSLAPDAQRRLDEFEAYCDEKIINGTNEETKELWNRTHIKALKTAATLAVFDNFNAPTITLEQADWAIQFVEYTTQNLIDRFNNWTLGDAYKSEDGQYALMLSILKQWVTRPWLELVSYGTGTSSMHADGIIPHSFLIKRLHSVKAFKDDRLGATNAIKRCIDTAIANGDIQKIDGSILNRYSKGQGTAYRYTKIKVRN